MSSTTAKAPAVAPAPASGIGAGHPGALPLDPRTTLLILVVLNALAMGTAPFPVVVACEVVALALLATCGLTRLWWGLAAAFTGAGLWLTVTPHLWASTLNAVLCLLAFWTCRFGVAVTVATFALTSIRPGHLVAALRASRVPAGLVTVIVVMLRFIPLTVHELRAITQAMQLRGVLPHGWTILAHPVRTTEYVLVPLLASVTRLSDDLAAAGVIRGMGSPTRPSSLVQPRFRLVDALLLLVVTGLLAFWLRTPGTLA